MPILVMCTNPQCGELFDAPDDASGGTVVCPACGTGQPVAAGAVSPGVAQAPLEPAEPPEAPPRQEPPAPEAAPAGLVPPGEESVEFAPVEEQGPAGSARFVMRTAAEPSAGPLAPPPEPVPLAGAPSGVGAPGPAGIPRSADRDGYQTVEEAQPQADREWDELFGLPDDRSLPAASAAAPAEPGVLEHRPAAVAVFLLGLLGMAGGAAAGLMWLPVHRVLAAYLGAGAGWAGGFVLGLLMVLGVERPEAGKLRCAVCGSLGPADAELCQWCGSTLSRQLPDPLAANCLWAWQYAFSNLRAVMALVVGVLGAYLLLTAGSLALAEYPQAAGAWRPVFVALGAVVVFLVFGYWMEYFLTAAAGTMERSDKAPDPQTPASLANIASGAKVLATAVLYLAPILTLGLLPLALLLVAVPRAGGALNPARPARLAWARLKDFVVLWLVLMLWTAAAGLGVTVVVVLHGLAVGLLAAVQGASQLAVSITLGAVAAVLLGFVGGLYGLVVFRCVGIYGRLNSRTLLGGRADDE